MRRYQIRRLSSISKRSSVCHSSPTFSIFSSLIAAKKFRIGPLAERGIIGSTAKSRKVGCGKLRSGLEEKNLREMMALMTFSELVMAVRSLPLYLSLFPENGLARVRVCGKRRILGSRHVIHVPEACFF